MKMRLNQPISRSRHRRGITLAELMAALSIFATVSSAAMYLLLSVDNAKEYVQGTVSSTSEVEFAVQRITENIRAGNAVSTSTSGATTITITTPPSSLISGNTFTITYSGLAGGNLTETYVNNGNGSTYSSGTLVHNLTQFTVSTLSGNAKAYQVILNARSTSGVQRTFVAFGRNL